MPETDDKTIAYKTKIFLENRCCMLAIVITGWSKLRIILLIISKLHFLAKKHTPKPFIQHRLPNLPIHRTVCPSVSGSDE